MRYHIDLNCDLGEGGAYDAQLMGLITSCNIACGGHYGDEASIAQTLKLAKQHKVKVGAHPSYPDFDNFGRKSLTLSAKDLKRTLKEQIERINTIAIEHNYPLTHIKPHGALYNDASRNPNIAELIIETVQELDLNLPIFSPPNSVLSKLSKGKIDIINEGFSDRNYTKDYTLVSRQHPNALLKTTSQIVNHVVNMVKKNRLKTVEGDILQIKVDTICMHSDTKNAVQHLRKLRDELAENDIEVKPYEI